MNLTIIKRLAHDGYFPVGMFLDACSEVASKVGIECMLDSFVKIEVGADGVDFDWKVSSGVNHE